VCCQCLDAALLVACETYVGPNRLPSKRWKPPWHGLGSVVAVNQVWRAVEVVLPLERRTDLNGNADGGGVVRGDERNQVRDAKLAERVVAHRHADFGGVPAAPRVTGEYPPHLDARPTFRPPQSRPTDQPTGGSLHYGRACPPTHLTVPHEDRHLPPRRNTILRSSEVPADLAVFDDEGIRVEVVLSPAAQLQTVSP